MAINKVIYDGNTLVDLTNDTVTPSTLAQGVTAHDASGASITGTMVASATTLADLGITASATELNYVDGVTSNIQTQLNNRSLSGTSTANGAATVLWSGSATTASFTVNNITDYKFFLVQPGSSSGSYLTWIIVPYCSVSNTTAFRGIGGFETTSSGTELYALRGSVSGTTVTIGEIIYRQSKAISTTVDLYVWRVIGIK